MGTKYKQRHRYWKFGTNWTENSSDRNNRRYSKGSRGIEDIFKLAEIANIVENGNQL